MKLYLIQFLIPMLAISACSSPNAKEKIQYPSKGSLLVFDTTSGKYKISSADKKLIAAWESFRQAISTSDYTTLKSLSLDSIVCPICVSINDEPVMSPDTFYTKYSKDIFSRDFISLIFDSSKIRCSYDYDSTYFNADDFLKTISDLNKPKVAQIFVSYPISNGDKEGTLGVLGFIETKLQYKFFFYSTIP